MTIELGLTDEPVNTNYAPLAVLMAHWRRQERFQPLETVEMNMRTRDFSPQDKLLQVMLSILAGCKTLVEVNSKLRQEIALAAVGQWTHFADQSTLSRTLDALTLKQIEQLRAAVRQIWQPRSGVEQHNWHGYLWLDFDLSGLPCGPQAQESQKGYFSGKKRPEDASWLASAP